MEDLMEDLMEGLDAEQRAVVSHRDGPAIVIAGPGSGKTRTLTTRVAALLKQGVAPEAIMLLTFTRASAKEMIRRAAALDPRALHCTAGTFHAVGSRIVNANARILRSDGADKPFTVLDSDDVEQLLKKQIEPLKAGAKNWPRASTVAKVISYAANTGMTIADALMSRAPDYEMHADAIQEVANAHTLAKLDANLLSYDDVLVYWGALLGDEEIGMQLRKRWTHVMIDEYQDTNRIQADIVERLTGRGGNVVVVGDAAQSIYSFRGASPGIVKAFHDHHPDATVYTITANYRSTSQIVALANSIDDAIDTGFPRELRAANGRQGERPRIVDVHDAAAEAAAIADAILADKEAGGEISNHAVLVRSMTSARRIEAELISRRIPFTVRGGTRIDEAAHIRDLLSIARVVTNLSHEPAWLRLLSRHPRIGDKAAGEIAGRVLLSYGTDDAAQMLREESDKRRTNLSILADAIEACGRSGTPAERLDRAMDIMDPVWADAWAEEWKARSRDLEAVVMIAREHATLEEFLTVITLDGSMEREAVVNTEKPDELPMVVSTIHGSKGLEYSIVHIPSFIQGGMPSMFSTGDDDRGEELRVAFVAATRAKDSLTFYRPRMNSQNNLTMASEFEPLLRRHVDIIQHKRDNHEGNARIDTSRRIDMRARLVTLPRT